jgi:hypothetical protein
MYISKAQAYPQAFGIIYTAVLSGIFLPPKRPNGAIPWLP